VTKNFALATRISQLVASGRLTISSQDNYTNFDFQPNLLKLNSKLPVNWSLTFYLSAAFEV